MTVAAHRNELASSIGDEHRTREGIMALLSGALRGIANAFSVSQQRQVDREIGHYLARSSGRLTDDVERQMTRHLTSSSFDPGR